MKPIYIVFSATPYKMGKFIRKMVGNRYNHVSISFKENLTPMFSFARRRVNMPFYGGFVEETLSRYSPHGQASKMKVCRLMISDEQYEKIVSFVKHLRQTKSEYLYNLYSAFFTIFGVRLPIRKAYTCTEFVGDLLCVAGLDFPLGKFHSLARMERHLSPYTLYIGDSRGYLASLPKERRDDFFQKMPMLTGTIATADSLARLTVRGLHGAIRGALHNHHP